MHEILGSSMFASAVFGNAAPDSGNSEVLALAGSEDQKERYLYPLLAGDLRSAFSMTEPENAGSDPTLLETTAVLEGDEWVINADTPGVTIVRDVATMEHPSEHPGRCRRSRRSRTGSPTRRRRCRRRG